MTRIVGRAVWRVMTIQGPSDPVHREGFSDKEKAIAVREYEDAAARWPKDGCVYLLDPDGVRVRTHDPSGLWCPARAMKPGGEE